MEGIRHTIETASTIGPTEIIIIVGVIVLLFGSAAIPKLAKSIGRAKGEFKKGMKEAKQKEKKQEEESNTGTEKKE
ncbi:MAG TPA: twin-arginine translocase TatA/TatE family subunit [Spirochaetota bacterium]|nr:twin-arginine translocase TatA/TatE family subunit [Spirochaetota bacterium]